MRLAKALIWSHLALVTGYAAPVNAQWLVYLPGVADHIGGPQFMEMESPALNGVPFAPTYGNPLFATAADAQLAADLFGLIGNPPATELFGPVPVPPNYAVWVTDAGRYAWARVSIATDLPVEPFGNAATFTFRPDAVTLAGRYNALGLAAYVTLDPSGTANDPPPLAVVTADLNGDGTVEVADLMTFLGAWFAGDAVGDWDVSGGCEVADVFAYLGDYFGGA